MKNALRPTSRRPFVDRSVNASVIIAAVLLGLGGCGQQSTPPAPVVATATAPIAQAPLTAPPPAVQYAPAATVATAPQPVPGASPPVAYTGRPVPTAPADYPNPPVQYVPVPVQAPPVVQRAPARVVAEAPRPAVASNRVGRVSSIEPIREKPAGTGAGGVLGGVLGAVVGNQFGHGNGRAAMTVIGAAGGAVAGNTVERNVRERIVAYQVSVHLDNGEVRSYQETNPGDLQVGDRVRIDGQRLRRL